MTFPYLKLIIFSIVLLAVLCAVAIPSIVPIAILPFVIYIAWKTYKYVEESWDDATNKGQTNFLSWLVDHSYDTGELDTKAARHSIFRWRGHTHSHQPKVKVPRTGGKFRGNFRIK